ncbi:hypothetical protein CAN33_0028595 [Aspergillus niger]|uniref:Uncharacterized protein n=1 Tax=Aspergillus niger TaxID=5061 RepID=A0A505HW51_ASPNG|nr:hypothetical protein CAN33_0028595 [Aspergillus niger]
MAMWRDRSVDLPAVLRANLHERRRRWLGRGYYQEFYGAFRRRAIIGHTITSGVYLLQLAISPATGQLHATPPYKWATARRMPNPQPSTASWRSLALAARHPRASTPSGRLSRGARITHLTGNWSIPSPARTHATLRGHRTPAAGPAVSAGRSAAPPTGAPAQRGGHPACKRSVVRK